MLTVLRREEKYPLYLRESFRYIALFSQLLQADTASANGSYMVRSLYFDTIDDKDFFDKMNEQNLRRKIRLRIYSPNAKTAKLEMKQKENQFQRKRSLSVSREHARQLVQGNYSVLLQYSEPFAAELFALMNEECYRPKSIVEYQRRAFMAPENNIRITFDTEIRATESNTELFSAQLPLYSVYPTDRAILEVKYNHFLPSYLSDVVSAIDKRKVSSSKYCQSRSIGYPLYL